VALRIDLDPYRAVRRRFRLRDHDPASLPERVTAEEAQQTLDANILRLRELQERLYAGHRWSLLLILQGMDTAGKDSAIKRVFSGINPQGCLVHSFKSPSDEELDHDYLWRTTLRLPRRGHIGVFNRSYYEEVLAVRVNPDLLAAQRLPPAVVSRDIWRNRFEDLVSHERHLARSGVVVRKIFLHISKKEQRQRLLKRLDDPAKHWKFSPRDLDQRQRWPQYVRAYDQMIRETTSAEAPWFVVPADRKWWTRAIVSAIVLDALEGLDLAFPEVTAEQRRDMVRIRQTLR
jgi:PPK2 family polyphosphate:nucleotide phosphotransferase